MRDAVRCGRPGKRRRLGCASDPRPLLTHLPHDFGVLLERDGRLRALRVPSVALCECFVFAFGAALFYACLVVNDALLDCAAFELPPITVFSSDLITEIPHPG